MKKLRITAALTAGIMLFGMAVPAFAAENAEQTTPQAAESTATPETAEQPGDATQETAAPADADTNDALQTEQSAFVRPQPQTEQTTPAYVEGQAIICVRGGADGLLDGAPEENGAASYGLAFTVEELMDVSTAVAEASIGLKTTEPDADEPMLMSLDDETDADLSTLMLVQSGMDTDALIAMLEENENVLYAEPNYIMVPYDTPTDPYYSYQSGENNTLNASAVVESRQRATSMNLVPVWNEADKTDKTPVVAIVDSGVDYEHPDLKNVMWSDGLKYEALTSLGGGMYGLNTTGGDEPSTDPMDRDVGHGTHCAGIVAAQWNDQGVAGVAPQAKIMACRFMNMEDGTMAGALRAYQYIETAKTQCGVNVVAINNSWGPASPDGESLHSLNAAVDQLGRAGVLTCFAVGNSTSDTTLNPHSTHDSSYALTVASLDSTGRASDFTSFSGRYVDVFAPGSQILSTTTRYPSETPALMAPTYLPQLMKPEDSYFYEDFEDATDVEMWQVALEQTVATTGKEEWNEHPEIVLPVGRDDAAGYDSKYSGGAKINIDALEEHEEFRDPAVAFKLPENALPQEALAGYEEGKPLRFAFQVGLDGLTMNKVVLVPLFKGADGGWYPLRHDGQMNMPYVSDRNWNQMTFLLDKNICEEMLAAQAANGGRLEVALLLYAEGATDYFTYDKTTGTPQLRIDDIGFGSSVVPYYYSNGTSMASPMVAGLAALLNSKLDDDGWQTGEEAAEMVARIKGAVDRYEVPGIDEREVLKDKSLSMGRIAATLALDDEDLVPVLDSLTIEGQTATLKGYFFGTKQGSVKLGDSAVQDIISWTDREIIFTLPEEATGLWEVTVTAADDDTQYGHNYFVMEQGDTGFTDLKAPNGIEIGELENGVKIYADSMALPQMTAANGSIYLTAGSMELEQSFLLCGSMADAAWQKLELPSEADLSYFVSLAAGKDRLYVQYMRETADGKSQPALAVLDTTTNQWIQDLTLTASGEDFSLVVYKDRLLLIDIKEVEDAERGRLWQLHIQYVDPDTGVTTDAPAEMQPKEMTLGSENRWNANASGDLLVIYNVRGGGFQYFNGSEWILPNTDLPSPLQKPSLAEEDPIIQIDQTVNYSLCATDDGIWAIGPVTVDGAYDTWRFDTTTQTWEARTDRHYSVTKTVENAGCCYDGKMYTLGYRHGNALELVLRSMAVSYTGPDKNPLAPPPAPTATPTAAPTAAPTQKPGSDPTPNPTVNPTAAPTPTPAAAFYARTTTIPATADESAPAALVVLLILSSCALTTLCLARKKRK